MGFLSSPLCIQASGGAKDQDRTGDPSLFRGMLYQLSYLGESNFLDFIKIPHSPMYIYQNSYLGEMKLFRDCTALVVEVKLLFKPVKLPNSLVIKLT